MSQSLLWLAAFLPLSAAPPTPGSAAGKKAPPGARVFGVAKVAQFDLAIRSGYARAEDRILYAVADSTKSILTFLDGAPVLSRKAGDWA